MGKYIVGLILWFVCLCVLCFYGMYVSEKQETKKQETVVKVVERVVEVSEKVDADYVIEIKTNDKMEDAVLKLSKLRSLLIGIKGVDAVSVREVKDEE